jgi:hypothetical protein
MSIIFIIIIIIIIIINGLNIVEVYSHEQSQICKQRKNITI